MSGDSPSLLTGDGRFRTVSSVVGDESMGDRGSLSGWVKVKFPTSGEESTASCGGAGDCVGWLLGLWIEKPLLCLQSNSAGFGGGTSNSGRTVIAICVGDE